MEEKARKVVLSKGDSITIVSSDTNDFSKIIVKHDKDGYLACKVKGTFNYL